ncbi:MAG: hypothetical protein K2K85_06155 [Clostridia bacterium]|nr:hypothetical protein [Clostridia bacterium]
MEKFENKKALTACRVIALIGILIGLFMFAFGIIVCSESDLFNYYGVKQIYNDSNIYGADYYTDSYKAMAITANNTSAIAKLMCAAVAGIGYVMIFGGLALMLGFIFKFASSFSNIKKKKVVKYIQQEDDEMEKYYDTKILMELLKKGVKDEDLTKGE